MIEQGRVIPALHFEVIPMKTIRIKSTHKASQGEFVEINEEDFNPLTMQLYVAGEISVAQPPEEKPIKKRKG